MLFKEPPVDFQKRFEIASCYLEHDGTFLLLHRHENKSQGGKWGVVAGKLDAGETAENAMIREMREETGVDASQKDLQYIGSRYVRHGGYDFIYHMFFIVLDRRPDITLSSHEHKDYRWVTPAEAFSMNLVDDLDECIRIRYDR